MKSIKTPFAPVHGLRATLVWISSGFSFSQKESGLQETEKKPFLLQPCLQALPPISENIASAGIMALKKMFYVASRRSAKGEHSSRNLATVLKVAVPDEPDTLTFKDTPNTRAAFIRNLRTPCSLYGYENGGVVASYTGEKKGPITVINADCSTLYRGAPFGSSMFNKFILYGNNVQSTCRKKVDDFNFSDMGQAPHFLVFKSSVLQNAPEAGPKFQDGSVSSLTKPLNYMIKPQLYKTPSETKTNTTIPFFETLTRKVTESAKPCLL